MAGTEWLANFNLNPQPPSPDDDPKRLVVVEKFFSALTASDDNINAEEYPLGNDDKSIMKNFAIALENELFQLYYLEKPREYKARVFTLNFNLSDKKNTSLRRRILQGLFSPNSLALASADQLASEDVLEKRNEQRDKYFSTQVLKRKEDEKKVDELLAIPSNLKKVKQEPAVHPLDQVQVPEFAQPPVALTDPIVEEGVVDEPAPEPVIETGEPPLSPEKTSRSASETVRELHEYAKSIKTKFYSVESEPLRLHLGLFVDYFMKHVHE